MATPRCYNLNLRSAGQRLGRNYWLELNVNVKSMILRNTFANICGGFSYGVASAVIEGRPLALEDVCALQVHLYCRDNDPSHC